MSEKVSIEFGYEKFCQKRFPLPTEEQVDKLERRLGIALPEDYRAFLLKFNGGWFTNPIISPTSKGCPEDGLEGLHGIGASHPSAELGSASDLALFDNNAPPKLLPIGATQMGGLIVLMTGPSGRGQVFYKEAYGQFYFLAVGIGEFFELLSDAAEE